MQRVRLESAESLARLFSWPAIPISNGASGRWRMAACCLRKASNVDSAEARLMPSSRSMRLTTRKICTGCLTTDRTEALSVPLGNQYAEQ